MTAQFEGQHTGEDVIITFRRHPVAMRRGFYELTIPFLIASVPVFVWPDNLNNLWVAFGGLGVGLLFFMYRWIGWYFSVFIVTNQRLRQITQKGFFNKSVIDLGISKIQNISYNVPGFTASFLGFGTVVVQTYVGDLYLEKIHHPTKIYNSLSDVIRKYGAPDASLQDEKITA